MKAEKQEMDRQEEEGQRNKIYSTPLLTLSLKSGAGYTLKPGPFLGYTPTAGRSKVIELCCALG